MSEHAFQTRLLLALSKIGGVRVWRQNVGTVRVPGSERFFRAGPPKGAADITGIIAPEGLRLEIECKAGTKRTPEQLAWGETMATLGAVYLVLDASIGVDAAVEAFHRAVCDRRGIQYVPPPAVTRKPRRAAG